jgi:hypothetical protein
MTGSEQSSTLQRVAFIGPESRVYHTDMRCPALLRDDRYWPVHRGFPNAERAILGDDGHVYEGRRLCRRCRS